MAKLTDFNAHEQQVLDTLKAKGGKMGEKHLLDIVGRERVDGLIRLQNRGLVMGGGGLVWLVDGTCQDCGETGDPCYCKRVEAEQETTPVSVVEAAVLEIITVYGGNVIKEVVFNAVLDKHQVHAGPATESLLERGWVDWDRDSIWITPEYGERAELGVPEMSEEEIAHCEAVEAADPDPLQEDYPGQRLPDQDAELLRRVEQWYSVNTERDKVNRRSLSVGTCARKLNLSRVLVASACRQLEARGVFEKIGVDSYQTSAGETAQPDRVITLFAGVTLTLRSDGFLVVAEEDGHSDFAVYSQHQVRQACECFTDRIGQPGMMRELTRTLRGVIAADHADDDIRILRTARGDAVERDKLAARIQNLALGYGYGHCRSDNDNQQRFKVKVTIELEPVDEGEYRQLGLDAQTAQRTFKIRS